MPSGIVTTAGTGTITANNLLVAVAGVGTITITIAKIYASVLVAGVASIAAKGNSGALAAKRYRR